MTAPSASYDRNRVMRLIEARIPELSDDDFALITQPAPPTAEPDLGARAQSDA
jgi:hypothetical protein